MAQTLWIYNCQIWAFHDFPESGNLCPQDLVAKRGFGTLNFHFCRERNLVFLPSHRKSRSSPKDIFFLSFLSFLDGKGIALNDGRVDCT